MFFASDIRTWILGDQSEGIIAFAGTFIIH